MTAEMKRVYTARDVADMLEVSLRYVYELARQGVIPGKYLQLEDTEKGTWIFPARSFDAWLDGNETPVRTRKRANGR